MTIPPEERERRRHVVEWARSANRRTGYIHDQMLEAINDRFISGELSLDEFYEELMVAIENCL